MFREFWRRAIAAGDPGPAYLAVAPNPDDLGIANYSFGIGIDQLGIDDGRAWAVINLSVTFRHLKV